jgi:serine/threonine protein kinase
LGVVYKTRQKSLNRLAALKLLAPERVVDERFAKRFAKEAQALAALNHPNIVTIYDFGQAGGFFYLLMEFVDGVNLRQAMRAAKFTPEQALAIVPPICDALQYAHEHGVVHRDIKPENLLLDKEGRVKIADFGIAKMMNAEAPDVGVTESLQAGTPQYMAPELKECRRTDHRADIYSLGVLLYELLTGELPSRPIDPPSKKVAIDVRLDAVVLHALEENPDRRYQTVAEVKTMVEAASAQKPRTRGKRLLAAAGVAFVTAIVFGVVAWEASVLINHKQNDSEGTYEMRANMWSALTASLLATIGFAETPNITAQQNAARERAAEDHRIYSADQLREIENYYQIANKRWNSPEAMDSLQKLVEKYTKANRTGCAILYLGQMSTGEKRETYLKQAIREFGDCYYGDGVQVGAYARFCLAEYYRGQGLEETANALLDEMRHNYPGAVDHRGKPLLAELPKQTDVLTLQKPAAEVKKPGYAQKAHASDGIGAEALPFVYVTNPNGTITITAYRGLGGKVVIPASLNGLPVVELGEKFHLSCKRVTALALPATLTALSTLFNCPILSDISVDAGNTRFSSEDGVLFDKARTTILQYPITKTGAYAIPATVSCIGHRSFYNCKGLSEITLPSGLKTIDVLAFGNCSGLTQVTFPASVQKLGSGAFSFCAGLTRLLFEGDAPHLYDPSLPTFEGTMNATVYYRAGARGWGKTFGGLPTAVWGAPPPNWQSLLDATQKKYVAWDEKAHVSDYDPKQYEVDGKRDEFEAEWLKLLEGEEPGNPGRNRPHPYDQAIYGLATIKSAKAAPLLVKIATERVVKDNLHRSCATKALGILGDKSTIPALIPLLYHYNFNTRWNAQIALVQLTGQNFGRDAEAWGKWYTENRKQLGGNLPAFTPAPVDWSCGSADKELKDWCDPKVQIEADEKMLGGSSPTVQPITRSDVRTRNADQTLSVHRQRRGNG